MGETRRFLALSLADPARWGAFALRLSPLVSMQPPDLLLLDITGIAHLHGDEAGLLAAAQSLFARHGVASEGLVADPPAAAMALCRAGLRGILHETAGPVAGLDIAALPLDPPTIATLRQLGLRRVGDLLRQPRAPLVRRFGTGLGAALDALTGATTPALGFLRPPPLLEAGRDFLEPLTTAEAIGPALTALITELCARLETAGQGARRLTLRGFRADGRMQEMALGLAQASRDAAHLARLLLPRIERLDPGPGFEHLRLGVLRAEPLGGVQAGFAGQGAAAEAAELARLFDRLATRVQAWRLQPEPNHWPEHEARPIPPALPAARRLATPPGWPRPGRPARLLRPAREIGAVALLPDAPPSLLRIGRHARRVRAAEGPERIAPAWWRDAAPSPRDYYRLEMEDGARLWVCRIGFGPAARWFLHGHL
jgi:protein ImuB